MNWKNVKEQIKLMKHYFIASMLVFIAGIFMGAVYSNQFQGFINSQLEVLKQIVESASDKPHQQWALFWIIFWNNASKSLLMIVLGGLFCGIIPLFFLLANGLLLGYIINVSAQKVSWLYVVKSIAPHGVLELPAIVIACAFGIRLGFLILKFMISILIPSRLSRSKSDLQNFVKSLFPVSIGLVAVLCVAAIIESTLTFWLAQS